MALQAISSKGSVIFLMSDKDGVTVKRLTHRAMELSFIENGHFKGII